MKVLVLLNEAAGTLAASQTGDERQRIRAGFEAAGVHVDVRAVPGKQLESSAKAATRDGYDAVIAGGGDGTLNTIAAALAGSDTAFGVVPLGTHNHFAKELSVPLELEPAVAALARGTTRRIDVAEVNGRLFLNFSGIGLHPQVVRQREVEQKSLGRFRLLRTILRKSIKPFALLIAFTRSLRSLPLLWVTITTGTGAHVGAISVRRLTPSVIVGNNVYQLKVFGLDNVTAPDRGMLHLLVAKATGPIGVVRLLLASVFRRLDNARDFEVLTHPSFTISLRRRRRLTVSIDGELMEMTTPLHYKVRPNGLKVIVPAAEPGTEGKE